MKQIYIFKHNPNPNAPPPLPHSFGPGIFALNSHTYNPLFEKNPGSAPGHRSSMEFAHSSFWASVFTRCK